MRWNDAAVRAALGTRGAGRQIEFSAVSTDSRSVTPGALFVALAGERFDGHDFLEAVSLAGGAGAVVRRGTTPVSGLEYYEVEDPLEAYGLLARHRRRAVPGPVVAVTGTNGKTSTKEMLTVALATRFRAHATRVNLNNLVGVPQTILAAPDQTEALAIEAGANLPGEMARHRTVIEPSLTVITNVAAGHLEGFGSLAQVLEEKLALAREVPLAVVGSGNPALAAGAQAVAARVITAGLDREAEVRPDRVELTEGGRARLGIEGLTFTLPLVGRHQAGNAMLVWAVARELGLEPRRVAQALESFTIPGGRGELTQHGRLTVLNDSYNANPASFLTAIELAAALRSGRRLVFVAGTMRELGPASARLHAEVAEKLVNLEPDLLAAVGDFGPALAPYRDRLRDRLLVAPDAESMGPLVAARLSGTELVVLKGSRGVALERMLPAMLARAAA